MNPVPRSWPLRPESPRLAASCRGSVLIVSLLLSAIIALSLMSYINLCTRTLKLSHRTFFADAGANLAETGLEEAVWSYNQMGTGVAVATAWSGWTLNSSTNTATRTLPTFTLDQNATGVVKVLVNGYNGSNGSPVVIAQSTITPYDGGAPIVKIIEITLKYTGPWVNGVVARNGITWNGHPTADSFVSSATPSTGPFTAYPGISGARANTTVASLAGSIGLGAQGVVNGNVLLGSGVTVSGGTITGTTSAGFNADFSLPPYPTTSSVSKYSNLGASIPSILPLSTDISSSNFAADGKYYYFCTTATLGTTTITSNYNVVLVGNGNTGMSSGLTIGSGASLIVYIDGPVNASGNGAINNSNWAGALQIFTSTASACSIGGNGTITACLYAPNSALTGNGGGNSGQLIGSYVANTITSNGHMDFHYDENLRSLTSSKPWSITTWREMQTAAERAAYAASLNF